MYNIRVKHADSARLGWARPCDHIAFANMYEVTWDDWKGANLSTLELQHKLIVIKDKSDGRKAS